MFKRIFKQKQRTYCYCPRCFKDLVNSNSYVSQYDGIVKYRCDKCGNVSFWDFITAPVPILRTCGDCCFLIEDNSGNAYCQKLYCTPQTQRLFTYK